METTDLFIGIGGEENRRSRVLSIKNELNPEKKVTNDSCDHQYRE
jgi:hypothetical protein